MARFEGRRRSVEHVGNVTLGTARGRLPNLLVGIGVAALGLSALVVSLVWGISKLLNDTSPHPPISGPQSSDIAIEVARAENTTNSLNSLPERPSKVTSPSQPPPLTDSKTDVLVNGRALTARKLRWVEKQIGSKPRAGSYWYDRRSGLFGVAGQPAAGLLRAGMKLGRLSPRASKGDTQVYLNGRHLPGSELQFYSMLLGPIRPGRYWMDSSGNVGFKGNPTPVDNLARRWTQAANAMRGSGGPAGKYLSGNEWSGEARIGGMPLTSGTWDRSGGNNHVISVDGEVLNLPPY